jgi:acetyl esterase/lipase
VKHRSVPLALFLFLALLPAARAGEEKKPAPVTGGNFAVKTVKDVAYNDAKDADPVKHKLDLYLPKGQKGFPVLFFVHGGGWRSGDKKIYGKFGEMFARNGIGTVIINYRLSPKVKHPAHIQDVARAFAWTQKHIGKYGGKADQLFVCGHSAGGHLVALLATDPTYLKAEKLTPAAVKGALPLSGVYTILPRGFFVKVFGDDAEVCKKASPLEHVTGKHCPFLIAYADKDMRFIDRMSEALGKSLKKCKCQAEVLKVSDRNHISIIRQAVTHEDDPLTQAMLRFIAKHSGLKLKPREVKKETK